MHLDWHRTQAPLVDEGEGLPPQGEQRKMPRRPRRSGPCHKGRSREPEAKSPSRPGLYLDCRFVVRGSRSVQKLLCYS